MTYAHLEALKKPRERKKPVKETACEKVYLNEERKKEAEKHEEQKYFERMKREMKA